MAHDREIRWPSVIVEPQIVQKPGQTCLLLEDDRRNWKGRSGKWAVDHGSQEICIHVFSINRNNPGPSRNSSTWNLWLF